MPAHLAIPPLKSQGIKTKLVPWIKELAPLSDGRWIEPFLGTGVVALNMGRPRALLSDTNPHIIRFYRDLHSGKIHPAAVQDHLLREGQRLRDAAGGGDAHYRFVRDRFNREHDPLDFLFLSRAGFNGMMRFNRRGDWNIPFCRKPDRFRQAYVTRIVNQVREAAARIRPGWRFENLPFDQVIPQAQAEDILYCDPPYSGRYADYYNAWTECQEQRLFELLSETPARFVLSTWHHNEYRENPMIARYWKRFPLATRDHFYHTGARLENRRAIVEALVFNFDAGTGRR